MFDIGAMELFVVAVIALVVVGPKELPSLLRTVTGFVRKVREMASDFRSGIDDLATEIEREVDPFGDLRKQEGLRPGMSPREITEHIMSNRDGEGENTIHSPENASLNEVDAIENEGDAHDFEGKIPQNESQTHENKKQTEKKDDDTKWESTS